MYPRTVRGWLVKRDRGRRLHHAGSQRYQQNKREGPRPPFFCVNNAGHKHKDLIINRMQTPGGSTECQAGALPAASAGEHTSSAPGALLGPFKSLFNCAHDKQAHAGILQPIKTVTTGRHFFQISTLSQSLSNIQTPSTF